MRRNRSKRHKPKHSPWVDNLAHDEGTEDGEFAATERESAAIPELRGTTEFSNLCVGAFSSVPCGSFLRTLSCSASVDGLALGSDSIP